MLLCITLCPLINYEKTVKILALKGLKFDFFQNAEISLWYNKLTSDIVESSKWIANRIWFHRLYNKITQVLR